MKGEDVGMKSEGAGMKDVQEEVKRFVEERGLGMKPEFCALDAVSEMGEVAKEVLKMYNYGRGGHGLRKGVESELGDLLYSIINLANHYNVDLGEEVRNAMKRYEKRLSKGNSPDSSNR